jgi:recombination protein RecR
MEFSSQIIEKAVQEIAKLPGIGRKSALRLVLHLLRQDGLQITQFTQAIQELHTGIRYCRECHHIADAELCQICLNDKRDQSLVCVVEGFKEVWAIENTGQYKGLYHVLGGLLSPIDGIGPTELHIASLMRRLETLPVKEVILALSPTMEGDTTAFYLTKKIKALPIRVSTLARGLPVGGELEYTDEVTLGRSILSRIQYE